VDSFPQIYPPKPCMHLSSPHMCYMPCVSQSSLFNHRWGVQGIKLNAV
jgi:hypothetical protein